MFDILKLLFILLNEKIIITGTSRGIGYELALKFANAGHQVLAISEKTPRILIEHENITCISVDLSNELDLVKVEKVLDDSWKTVDAIVNNAGSFLLKLRKKIMKVSIR
jgi:short-subunit dehydrogenase